MDQTKRNTPKVWQSLRQTLAVFQYGRRAIGLVWHSSRSITVIIAILTVVAGLLPGAIAYIGKLIIDGVIVAAHGTESDRAIALGYLGLEAIAVALLAGGKQGLSICQSLLRVLLGQKVNVLILEKALTLHLVNFEDSEFYDKMTRARREASVRPLSLVSGTFGLLQNILSLAIYGGLLLRFNFWAVAILMVAAVPAFIAETRFAGQAFRLFRWRAPETREQNYLETLIARDDYAMEVQLYQLGPSMLERYHHIFQRFYREDRTLTIRRGVWSYLLSLLSSAAFYGTYAWIVIEAIAGQISLGELTMYLTVFRQGQSTFSTVLSSIGSMYEDSLYMSTLYEFLEQEIPEYGGHASKGLFPGDGIRFENVSFSYPGNPKPALKQVSLHLKPGDKLAIVGENGSGKTTLIKLLTRLYQPDSGRILLDGLDLQEWDIAVLHQRIGVIFQNFVRYQFTVGENVGVGDVSHAAEQGRWEDATEKGMARPFIEELPAGFGTQLGRWFKGGQELSGGQWQKIALSRAFMRTEADILILDEPTAAMDAEAEVRIFDHLRAVTQNQMVIVISHRFSTVRLADQIVVLARGELVEQGSHEELLAANGRYARLFSLQAAGYQ